ncbi:MAG TPA: hypothetical protein PK156_05940 [Polyangium sp.]|nr:hypothetical protein [Polyangium sp.]
MRRLADHPEGISASTLYSRDSDGNFERLEVRLDNLVLYGLLQVGKRAGERVYVLPRIICVYLDAQRQYGGNIHMIKHIVKKQLAPDSSKARDLV